MNNIPCIHLNFSSFPLPSLKTHDVSMRSAIIRVFYKSAVSFVCLISVLAIISLKSLALYKFNMVHYQEEMEQIEIVESNFQVKGLTLIVWSFSVFSILNELLMILSANDQIRVYQSLRHRTRMELIVALIRQKYYHDKNARAFITKNSSSQFLETIDDEMDADKMLNYRVNGLNRRN